MSYYGSFLKTYDIHIPNKINVAFWIYCVEALKLHKEKNTKTLAAKILIYHLLRKEKCRELSLSNSLKNFAINFGERICILSPESHRSSYLFIVDVYFWNTYICQYK